MCFGAFGKFSGSFRKGCGAFFNSLRRKLWGGKSPYSGRTGGHCFSCGKNPGTLRGGNYYSLAAELNRKCAARADFSEYLEKLLNITGRCGIDRAAGKKTPVKVTPMEAVKTSEIIERGKLAVLQNCSVDLIESWLCMELSRVFGGNL